MSIEEIRNSNSDELVDVINSHKTWKKDINICQMSQKNIELTQSSQLLGISALKKKENSWEVIEPNRKLSHNEICAIARSGERKKIIQAYENKLKELEEKIVIEDGKNLNILKRNRKKCKKVINDLVPNTSYTIIFPSEGNQCHI